MKDGPHQLDYGRRESRHSAHRGMLARFVVGVIVGPIVAVILAFPLIYFGTTVAPRMNQFDLLAIVIDVAAVMGFFAGVSWAVRRPRPDAD